MMYKLVFSLVLGLFLSNPLLAQTPIEQLKELEVTAANGWDKIDVAIGLARLYVGEGMIEEGFEQINNIYSWSEEYNLPQGKAYGKIFENLNAYLNDYDADKAIQLCIEAMQIAENTMDNNAYVYAGYQLAENYIWEKGDVQKGKEIVLGLINRLDESVLAKNEGSLYKVLGVAYDREGNLEESLKYYEKARFVFQEMVDNPPIDDRISRVSSQNMDGEFHLGSVLDSMGDLYQKLGDNYKAAELKLDALEQMKKRGIPIDVGWMYGNLGELYLSMGRYNEALENLQIGREIFDELDSKVEIARTNATMISLFVELQDFEEAEKYVTQNLEYYKNVDNQFMYAPTLVQAIRIALNRNDIERAEDLIELGIPVVAALNNKDRSARFSLLRGRVEESKQNYTAAEGLIRQCISLYAELTDTSGLGNCELALAGVFLKSGKIDSAFKYVETSLERGVKSGELDKISDSYELLSLIYAENGDFENAYKNHQNYKAFNDSIYTTDAQAILKDEQVRQNIVAFQNEKELAEQNAVLLGQLNQLYLVVGGVLLILLLVSVYFFFNLKKVQAKVQMQNEQLIQLNATKDKFFGIIAHDLRSPLMGLQSVGNQISYFIKKDQKDKLETLAARIEFSAKKLTELLDNLLSWALLQNGMNSYQPDQVNLKKEVGFAIDLLSTVAEAKGINLKNRVKQDVEVFADESAVQTVLRNIISNAIKFTSKGDEVIISIKEENSKAIIEVTDTGIGISAERLPTLFALNKRSEKGTQGEKGTGLGLVLCKELLELNKGSISVKSDIGKGSSLFFELPIYKSTI